MPEPEVEDESVTVPLKPAPHKQEAAVTAAVTPAEVLLSAGHGVHAAEDNVTDLNVLEGQAEAVPPGPVNPAKAMHSDTEEDAVSAVPVLDGHVSHEAALPTPDL